MYFHKISTQIFVIFFESFTDNDFQLSFYQNCKNLSRLHKIFQKFNWRVQIFFRKWQLKFHRYLLLRSIWNPRMFAVSRRYSSGTMSSAFFWEVRRRFVSITALEVSCQEGNQNDDGRGMQCWAKIKNVRSIATEIITFSRKILRYVSLTSLYFIIFGVFFQFS